MQRILAVHLPQLSVDLARRRRPTATCILLVERSGGRALVARCCEAARARGVRAGMAVSEAAMLAGGEGVAVEPFDDAREARELTALGRWAQRFTPVVAPAPPDALLLEVAGLQRLHEGEASLAQWVGRGIAALGLRARLAVASTIGCAWAAARYGRESPLLVPAGGEREALAPLPIEALRIPDETAAALRELSILTVGELLALERRRLAARFGGDLALRVDQALGEAWEPCAPLREERTATEEIEFAGPVTELEGVRRAMAALLAALLEKLARDGSYPRELALAIFPSDAPPQRIRLAPSRPTGDARHLLELATQALERARLGYGVERIQIQATRIESLPRRQERAFGAQGEAAPTDEALERELAKLLDRLAGRLGREALRVGDVLESHWPERAFALRSPEAAAVGEARAARAPRPSILLRRPEGVVAGVEAAPGELPGRFRWRGRWFEIAARSGPERIAPPWWDDASQTARCRSYWRVRTACGRCQWLFRSDSGELFLHGEWA